VRTRIWALFAAAGMVGTVALAGCGLAVQSADLFLLTRMGQGGSLMMLVSDGGTIRCNGRAARTLPDPLLIEARQLASDLDKDAKTGLRIAPVAGGVYSYTVKLQHGTISFPDAAGAAHPELARLELFALRAARGPCA
jgi:hypothetical protein